MKIVVGVAHRHVRAYFVTESGARTVIPEVSLSKFTHGGRWTMNFSEEIDGLDLVSSAKVFELFQAAMNKVKEIDPEWNVEPEQETSHDRAD